jgi:Na+(H+)/acetate symporter ActP
MEDGVTETLRVTQLYTVSQIRSDGTVRFQLLEVGNPVSLSFIVFVDVLCSVLCSEGSSAWTQVDEE